MNRHESETLEAPERTGELAYKAKLAAHVRSRPLRGQCDEREHRRHSEDREEREGLDL